MRVLINKKRFFAVLGLLGLLFIALDIFFNRAVLFGYYFRCRGLFYYGRDIALAPLLAGALVKAFFFLALYSQVCDYFPKLRGGFIFGLILGLLLYLPFALTQFAVLVFGQPLRAVLAEWLWQGFTSYLMAGALCGSLYRSKPTAVAPAS